MRNQVIAVLRLSRYSLAIAAAIALISSVLAIVALQSPASAATRVPGIDVSHHQGEIKWDKVRAAGIRFAFIKVTQGTSFKDPRRGNMLLAHHFGVIPGAYHFGIPTSSPANGARQADHFIANGGNWQPNKGVLPGTLDIEANPYGPSCYGLTRTQMRAWIKAFHVQYSKRTGTHPIIYTSPGWWDSCVGDWAWMKKQSRLWVAHWFVNQPRTPVTWTNWNFWQYTDRGSVNGISGNVDRDWFNGSLAVLRNFANEGGKVYQRCGSGTGTKSCVYTRYADEVRVRLRYNDGVTRVNGYADHITAGNFNSVAVWVERCHLQTGDCKMLGTRDGRNTDKVTTATVSTARGYKYRVCAWWTDNQGWNLLKCSPSVVRSKMPD